VRRRSRGADGPAASVLAGVGAVATRAAATGVETGLAPHAEFLTVSEAHQVAVPRGLKVQAHEPDFESGRDGVRAAHGVTLTAVFGANHHRESW
jgi:hypothetical protein